MDDVKFEMDRSDQGIADTLGSVGAILADTQVRSTPGRSGTARFIEGALYRREPTLKYNRRFAIDGHFQETRSLPQLLGSAAVSDLAHRLL
ncbi:MAG TPA: hypothetical protein VFH89_13030 [Sphingomicrobium sp.]|jgi:hypothetical protein|nr:hypothetical protein [Sphingomicrobium sp.]